MENKDKLNQELSDSFADFFGMPHRAIKFTGIEKAQGTRCERCKKYITNKPKDVVCPRCFFVLLGDFDDYIANRDIEWQKRRDQCYLDTGKYPEQLEQGMIDPKYYDGLPER